jgi:hypothetical protein
MQDNSPRENSCPSIFSPSSPPVCLVLRALRDGDDVTFLEAQIAILIRIKCKQRHGLIPIQAAGLLLEHRLRRGWPGRLIVVIAHASAIAAIPNAVERFIGVRARAWRVVIDFVCPSIRSLRVVSVLVVVAPSRTDSV